ncbi:MAG: hypothetical protein RR869_08700 [Lachnospiraceae bacterium]
MILFIGAEDKGYFVRETAKIHNQELVFIAYSTNIDSQVDEILSYTNCEYLIFDIEQYLDKAENLAEEIKRIQRAKNGTIIIYAAGYDRQSKMIQELIFSGVIYFILSANPGEAKVELERCMSGYYKEVQEKEINTFTQQKHLEVASSIKIGLTGACHRIGTTTQSLQLVKYLQLKGHKACYVQVNSNQYVETLERYFNTTHDPYLGKVTFAGIDMYYKQENLLEVLNQGYAYYIYDFGTYSDTDFNKTSFLEKDIRIFVMGSKANEIMQTDAVIRNIYYKDVSYIFSFVSELEKPDVLELMEERAETTFFGEYAPDPFDYIPNPIYEKLLPVQYQGLKTLKKKRGLFAKKQSKRKSNE